eukprot:scpid107902/ scgid18438/ 
MDNGITLSLLEGQTIMLYTHHIFVVIFLTGAETPAQVDEKKKSLFNRHVYISCNQQPTTYEIIKKISACLGFDPVGALHRSPKCNSVVIKLPNQKTLPLVHSSVAR